MAKTETKQELIQAIEKSYEKFNLELNKLTSEQKNAQFQTEIDTKKCGARWIYDKCVRDLAIHLYEWQILMEIFIKNIKNGLQKDYLPEEYRKNYHEMDKMIVEKHQKTTLDEALKLLESSNNTIYNLINELSEEELFTKGFHKCTYTTTLAAYFVSVTSSPYEQAAKILKNHAKSFKNE